MKTKTLFASALAVLWLTACEKGLVDEAEPTRRVTLTLQLVTLAVFHRLALALAKIPQHLKVYLVLLKLIFHSSVRMYSELTNYPESPRAAH